MRNRFTIITIFKSNLSIHITVIFGKPKTFFIHNTHMNMKLSHLFINPKTISCSIIVFKFIFSNSICKITSNFFRITMELKLRSHFTRSHRITSITFRIRFRNSRSSQTPIFTYSKQFIRNISIGIRISQFNKISISIRRLAKIFLNTNLSTTIRSNQTILFNKPMSTGMNFNFSTTKTSFSTSRNIAMSNEISKFHTTHSIPSPLNSRNVNSTSSSLTFCHKRQRKTVVVHTIIISNKSIYFSRFL